ncbi:MFS transporter [Nocardia wallacei]|uniref:MFS transporter n=1 Tax=Nocardia wallacei TaxID=480035 RepID=UPI0024579AC1|nr:MFS transporter [Nocardia wallacei]
MRAHNAVPLGAGFSRLWTASAISNIGDGVTLVAGPLLVASLTTSPATVAGAAFVQQLPWLLFVLVSGVFVDRLDRRRLIVTVTRQRQVPDHLRGRVGSVYSLFDLGGAALGSLLGAVIAQAFGVVASFWLAATTMTCVAALAWRSLGRGAVGPRGQGSSGLT